MRKRTIIILIIVASLFLNACKRPQRIPIYTINEEVAFTDASKGSITLDSDAEKSNDIIKFSFMINLNESFTFDELFSYYTITIGKNGYDLYRYDDTNKQAIHIREDYFITINDSEVSINDLSGYKFSIGKTKVSFIFKSNYIDNQTIEKVSFTIQSINEYIIASFKL